MFFVITDFQINNDESAAPSTITWPTRPGNLAAASGKYTTGCSVSSSKSEGSILALPTAKTKASLTTCPSTLESTLLVTVYTPPSNDSVVTISESSP